MLHSNLFQSKEGPSQILSIKTKTSNTKNSSVSGFSSYLFRLVLQTFKLRNTTLPTSSQWYFFTLLLGDLFLFGKNQQQQSTLASLLPDARDTEKLRSMLHVKSKFSTNRCGLILPKVKEIYFTDLPNLYTSKEHESRVYRSLQLFYTHARGPMVEYYKTLLIEEFSNIWLHGRRRCEIQSLTGHYCKYPIHDELKQQHCTDFESMGACNCGKTRKKRLDPFSLIDANFHFFNSRCCERFISIDLPKMGDFHNWSLLILGKASSSYDFSSGLTQDGFKLRYKYLIPFEINSPPTSNQQRNSLQQNQNQQISDEEFPSLQNSTISRGNNNNNRGNNNRRGRRNDDYHQNSQRSSNSRQQHSQQQQQQQQRKGGWIGYEYECPCGHRFIEPLHSIQNYYAKQTNNTNISQNDQFLTIEVAFRTEMPLYTTCRSKSKSHCGFAQLQRIFICTPVNLAVKINPRVQIVGNFSGTTKKLTFTLGQLIPIPNDTFVCLRIPYVFEYENNPILLGQISPNSNSFKLVC